jgi:hypothetical protein
MGQINWFDFSRIATSWTSHKIEPLVAPLEEASLLSLIG